MELIEQYQVPFYGFGHTHNYRENFRTNFYYKNLTPGIYYMNVASLGKSAENQYAVMAVDGNGLSLVPAQKGVWPVVMITAPVDRALGTNPNPYTYEIPQKSNNPIRALVFDSNPVSQVQFSIDGSPVWQDMQQIEGRRSGRVTGTPPPPPPELTPSRSGRRAPPWSRTPSPLPSIRPCRAPSYPP